ncbi:MAG TPA: efflux RND transporter periplasmic adaptor subunit [Steroidobacteraceae bacterium]|jgi:cobalt-zinc-cadmium efflux system membrane fusion protein|nr:efflux RND transporter periplasmic adaptor subunit [Steroidobacteraceae bacterium]
MKLISLVLTALLSCALAGCGGARPEPAEQSAPEVTAEGAPAEARIALSPEQVAAAAIELATAGPARLREILPLYGAIAANAERMRDVAARYPGVIHSVSHKVGDAVRQGEPLATVESNESLQTYAVTAPLAGVITSRNANVGEQTGDRPLFVVADLSTVWVELSLFPRDAAKARVGQTAKVKSPDVDYTADGKVTYVAPFGSSSNQTLTARVQLDNTQRRWAPGLYVTAELTLSEREVPLTVRKTAIQMLRDSPVVFVQGPSGFEARPVKLGRSDGEITEVLEGLRAGETYAAANSYVLKAEALKSEAAED